MAISRNPAQYLQRKQLNATSLFAGKLDINNLLVTRIPTKNTTLKAIAAEGKENAPDRAKFYPWPGTENNNGE